MTLLIAVAFQAKTTNALISQQTLAWYWGSDTSAASVATGDVNGDGSVEVIAGGYSNDLTRWNGFVVVLNGATLAPLYSLGWFWTYDTQVASVAVGDVNGDTKLEVVACGAFFDNTRWNAFVVVLNGATLAPLAVITWYWISDTQAASVAVGDVNGDTKLEVIAGGSFFDNTRTNAWLAVLNGATLAPLSVLTWYWTSNTYVSAVAVGNATGGATQNVVAGGAFSDGTRLNAWVAALSGTLATSWALTWYWTGDTQVTSLAVGDVNGDTKGEVVAGGSFFDGTRPNAWVATLNGATSAPLSVIMWYWVSTTTVNSLTIGSFSSATTIDVLACGAYNDLSKNNAFLVDLSGATLAVLSTTNWFQTSDTSAYSVAIGNFGLGNRAVVSGTFFDLSRANAQITVWG